MGGLVRWSTANGKRYLSRKDSMEMIFGKAIPLDFEPKLYVVITSLIFQVIAHYIMGYLYTFLPYLSYMFRCVLHHPQRELRITCSNYLIFIKLLPSVVFQDLKYFIRKLYNVIYNY
jgi:hypothetical protein